MPLPNAPKPGSPLKAGSPKPGAGGKLLGEELRKQVDAENQRNTHATDELAETCGRLEDELEELKAKYEMYFLGVERFEPVRWRDEVKKNIARLKSQFTRNTGLRFRIQTLHARYLSYERLWLRAGKEKEEGTYRRDLFKARLHRRDDAPAQKKPKKAAEAGPPEDVDLGDDWSGDGGARDDFNTGVEHVDEIPAPSSSLATPPPRPAAKPPPPPPGARPPAPATPRAPSAGAQSGLADSQMRALYDAYVSAKKRCKEDVSRLTYDSVAKSVQKQIPELMAKYKAKAVDFKVVIKEGKAILKAVPKA